MEDIEEKLAVRLEEEAINRVCDVAASLKDWADYFQAHGEFHPDVLLVFAPRSDIEILLLGEMLCILGQVRTVAEEEAEKERVPS